MLVKKALFLLASLILFSQEISYADKAIISQASGSTIKIADINGNAYPATIPVSASFSAASGDTSKIADRLGNVFTGANVGLGYALDVNLRAGTPTTIAVTNTGTFATQPTQATGSSIKIVDVNGNAYPAIIPVSASVSAASGDTSKVADRSGNAITGQSVGLGYALDVNLRSGTPTTIAVTNTGTFVTQNTPATGASLKILDTNGNGYPATIPVSFTSASGNTSQVADRIGNVFTGINVGLGYALDVNLRSGTPSTIAVTNTGTFVTQNTPATGSSMKIVDAIGNAYPTTIPVSFASGGTVKNADRTGNVFTGINVGLGYPMDINLRSGTPTTIAVTNVGTFATQDTPATGATVKIVDQLGNAFTQTSGGENITPTTGSTIKVAGNTGGVFSGQQLGSGYAIDVNLRSGTPTTIAVTNTGTFATQPTPATGSSIKILDINGNGFTSTVSGLDDALNVFPSSGSTIILADRSKNALTSAKVGMSRALDVNLLSGTPTTITVIPGTTGGWSAATQASLSTVVQFVKAGAGTFGGYFFYNPNSTVSFLQVYDVAATANASSINQKLIMGIPATSAANVELTNGIAMVNGIYVTASNTPTTITANTIPIQGSVIYK